MPTKKRITANNWTEYVEIINGISRAVQRSLRVQVLTTKPIYTARGLLVVYKGGSERVSVSQLETLSRALINLDGYTVEEFQHSITGLKLAMNSNKSVFWSAFMAIETYPDSGELLALELTYCAVSRTLTLSSGS